MSALLELGGFIVSVGALAFTGVSALGDSRSRRDERAAQARRDAEAGQARADAVEVARRKELADAEAAAYAKGQQDAVERAHDEATAEQLRRLTEQMDAIQGGAPHDGAAGD